MNKSLKATCGILAVILVIISIVASAGFTIQQSNQLQNKQIKNSVEFKSVEQSREIQTQLFEAKKQEMEILKNQLTTIKDSGDKAVNSLPKDYITAKQNTRNQTQKQLSSTQEKLSNVSAELSNINNALLSPIDTSKLKVKSESGYIALFEMIANILNKFNTSKEKPFTSDGLLMAFFIFISAVFEVLAVVLYILNRKVLSIIGFVISFLCTFLLMTSMAVGLEAIIIFAGMSVVLDLSKMILMKIAFSDAVSNFSSSTPPIENSKQPISLKTPKAIGLGTKEPVIAKKIGFDMPQKQPTTYKLKGTHDIKSDDIKKYIDYMNQTSTNDISKGYMHIAKNIGISADKGRKIKAYLEHENVIKVDGMTTKILKKP